MCPNLPKIKEKIAVYCTSDTYFKNVTEKIEVFKKGEKVQIGAKKEVK